MRRASRVDTNHRELIDAARRLGAIVVETYQVGRGCPDAFVYTPLTGWFAVEIKTETGKLLPSQIALAQICEVVVWRNYNDVLKSLAFPKARRK